MKQTPSFPEFRLIELQDRQLFEDFFRARPPETSEFTFTNLYAWRRVYQYRFCRYREGLLVLKSSGGRLSFLQPLVTGDPAGAVDDCLDWLAGKGARPLVERAGESFVKLLPAGRYRVVSDRDNADYLYRARDLAELKGEKYHAKLNLWNQFTRKYRYRYRRVTPAMIPDCVRFVRRWCEKRRCDEFSGMEEEKCAVFRMLGHFSRLGAFGGVIEIGGGIAAITLGERLNPSTIVIHMEKADDGFTGLYQAINREFIVDRGEGFAFVNREQDLGVPGLRRAKKSYHPLRLVEKFTIARPDDRPAAEKGS